MNDPEAAAGAIKWLRDKADQKMHNAAALFAQIQQMQERAQKLQRDAEQHYSWAETFEALLPAKVEDDA